MNRFGLFQCPILGSFHAFLVQTNATQAVNQRSPYRCIKKLLNEKNSPGALDDFPEQALTKEMLYLTTHSAHCIYDYMASDGSSQSLPTRNHNYQVLNGLGVPRLMQRYYMYIYMCVCVCVCKREKER